MCSKAYSYVRFSTPEQRQGDSLRRQTELSAQYAEKHGLILDDSLQFQDLGTSAYSGKHLTDKAALGQFLALVESGKIQGGSVLLVESFDRLSRQEITKALQLFLDIINKNIKIVTLLDNREYTKETVNANVGELIVSLTIMSRAHEESATKSKRLKEAWQKKRERANNMKVTSRCPAWLKLDKEKNRFAVIEDGKKTIRRIFDMKLAGKGATSIVKELNSTPGVWRPRVGKTKKLADGWRESYVKKILKSRSVIGELQPHRLVEGVRKPIGSSIPDYFPAVVDRAAFYRVQDQFRYNNHKGGKTGKVNNLFSHIAKCGYCGGPMAFIDKGRAGNKRQYLVCDRARRKSIDCCNLTVRYDEFESLVLTYCKGLRPKDILADNDESAIALLETERVANESELRSIGEEIENIAASISRTRDDRVRETLENSMAERFDRKDSIQQHMNQIEQQINTLSRSVEDTQLILDSLNELLAFLQTPESKELIDVRLKLRNQIRKLLNVIDVFPAGQRLSEETVQKTLKDMSMQIPAFKDPLGYAWLKEELQREVENPRDFRYYCLQFSSGSFRFIHPAENLSLALDVENGGTVVRNWYERPDGIIVCQEFTDGNDKVKVRWYKKSIRGDAGELLKEYSVTDLKPIKFSKVDVHGLV
jgi:DNA invertase Pin-like site-specific DNA recombinase